MTRTALPSRGLTALLAVALLVLAAGPAAATVADALRTDCCHGSCPVPEAPPPDGAATCCAPLHAAPHDADAVPAPSAHHAVLVALVTDSVRPRTIPRTPAPPLDTGPPPGPRRHLALSVFLV